jgi:dTDP-glucose 4,6-dehydratase
MERNPLAEDLAAIGERGGDIWPKLKGARLFVTGGTGFIGTWVLESLVWLNDHHNLDVSAVVLTRDPAAFARKAPHIAAHACISLLEGDVRNFKFPEGRFSIVIHGATDASAKLLAGAPLRMFDTIVEGTRHTLDLAVHANAEKFLLLGSGAVYGELPAPNMHYQESDMSGPNCMDAGAAYAEGKRAAELLCAIYAKQHAIEMKVARCFAFVGPHLPIDSHYAIGNFIRDAMNGKPIVVNGDGTPVRSYLYAADLVYWLWAVLLAGRSSVAYNIGSDEAVSIGELASEVDRVLHGGGVRILQGADPGKTAKRYVPSTSRAETELGLGRTVSLEQAIIKTARWHGWKEQA